MSINDLAAIGVPPFPIDGQYKDDSFAYASASNGNIWEYNTSAVRLGSIPKSPVQAGIIASGASPTSQVRACWALAANNQSLKRVYYVNPTGHLADLGTNMSDGQWHEGTLASWNWGVRPGGLEYAIGNASLLRIGFWGPDGILYEAYCDVNGDGDPLNWKWYNPLDTVLPTEK